MDNINRWAEKLRKNVFLEWESKYSKWNPGFKIFYSPVYENPKIMILSYNPGGGEKETTWKEDLNEYKKGNFSVQTYHTYADRDKTLAKELQKFFDGKEDQLRKSVPIPILFFRSKKITQWKRDFTKLYSEEERKNAEKFCYKISKEIIEKINPSSILVVGIKTYDAIKKHSIITLCDDKKPETGTYGKRKERICIESHWNGKPVFSVRHLSGSVKTEDFIKMRKRFFEIINKQSKKRE